MPSQKGTKISFLRAIFSNKKKAIQQNKVAKIVVPHFEELSVKNLYGDAMKDEVIKDYLPELEMNSNRFPEREFFFGILNSLRPEYVKRLSKMQTKLGMKQMQKILKKISLCQMKIGIKS